MIAIKREQHHEPVWERFAEPPALAADADGVACLANRLRNRSGRADYALRKKTVEPVLAIIKHLMKFPQVMVRGFEHVEREWRLVALAWNLKRMNVLQML
jgi:hypothetical protein